MVVVMHPDAGLFHQTVDMETRPKCGIIVDDAIMRMSREKVAAETDVTLQLVHVRECRQSAERMIDSSQGAQTWRRGRYGCCSCCSCYSCCPF